MEGEGGLFKGQKRGKKEGIEVGSGVRGTSYPGLLPLTVRHEAGVRGLQ